jgi:hypothetical protein
VNIETALGWRVLASTVGAPNGVASLDSDGLVPSSQLPSYVDEILEYDTADDFPATGDPAKIYLAEDTGDIYRWGGTEYVNMGSASGGLALGETSTTAYRGDRGKAAYDHSQVTSGNPHGTTGDDILQTSGDTETVTAGIAKKADSATVTTALALKADASAILPAYRAYGDVNPYQTQLDCECGPWTVSAVYETQTSINLQVSSTGGLDTRWRAQIETSQAGTVVANESAWVDSTPYVIGNSLESDLIAAHGTLWDTQGGEIWEFDMMSEGTSVLMISTRQIAPPQ